MSDRKLNDRIPTWDGHENSFAEFRERCLWYERGLSWKDREQAIGKIASGMTGQPWKTLEGLSLEERDELCKCGMDTFLDFLKEAILEAGVPEAGRRFSEYLGRFQRKTGDTMKKYITEHKQMQQKVEKAMGVLETKRAKHLDILGLIKKEAAKEASVAEGGSHHSRNAATATSQAQVQTPRTTGSSPDVQADEEADAAQEEADGLGDDDGGGYQSQWQPWWWSSSWQSQQQWWGASDWEDKTTTKKPFTRKWYETFQEKAIRALTRVVVDNELDPEDGDVKILITAVEKIRDTIFPDMFTGWLLLQRSGLDATERATILARTTESLAQKDIENALMSQWMDGDLRERDRKKGIHITRAFYGDESDEEATHEAHHAEGNPEQGDGEPSYDENDDEVNDDQNLQEVDYGDAFVNFSEDEFDPKELSDAEERTLCEEALATIRDIKKAQGQNRRTLVQARSMIGEMKKSRRFFKKKTAFKKNDKAYVAGPSPPPRPHFQSRPKVPHKPQQRDFQKKPKCLKCGGPHFSQQCTQKSAPSTSKPRSAHLVFGLIGGPESLAQGGVPTSSSAMEQGSWTPWPESPDAPAVPVSAPASSSTRTTAAPVPREAPPPPPGVFAAARLQGSREGEAPRSQPPGEGPPHYGRAFSSSAHDDSPPGRPLRDEPLPRGEPEHPDGQLRPRPQDEDDGRRGFGIWMWNRRPGTEWEDLSSEESASPEPTPRFIIAKEGRIAYEGSYTQVNQWNLRPMGAPVPEDVPSQGLDFMNEQLCLDFIRKNLRENYWMSRRNQDAQVVLTGNAEIDGLDPTAYGPKWTTADVHIAAGSHTGEVPLPQGQFQRPKHDRVSEGPKERHDKKWNKRQVIAWTPEREREHADRRELQILKRRLKEAHKRLNAVYIRRGKMQRTFPPVPREVNQYLNTALVYIRELIEIYNAEERMEYNALCDDLRTALTQRQAALPASNTGTTEVAASARQQPCVQPRSGQVRSRSRDRSRDKRSSPRRRSRDRERGGDNQPRRSRERPPRSRDRQSRRSREREVSREREQRYRSRERSREPRRESSPLPKKKPREDPKPPSRSPRAEPREEPERTERRREAVLDKAQANRQELKDRTLPGLAPVGATTAVSSAGSSHVPDARSSACSGHVPEAGSSTEVREGSLTLRPGPGDGGPPPLEGGGARLHNFNVDSTVAPVQDASAAPPAASSAASQQGASLPPPPAPVPRTPSGPPAGPPEGASSGKGQSKDKKEDLPKSIQWSKGAGKGSEEICTDGSYKPQYPPPNYRKHGNRRGVHGYQYKEDELKPCARPNENQFTQDWSVLGDEELIVWMVDTSQEADESKWAFYPPFICAEIEKSYRLHHPSYRYAPSRNNKYDIVFADMKQVHGKSPARSVKKCVLRISANGCTAAWPLAPCVGSRNEWTVIDSYSSLQVDPSWSELPYYHSKAPFWGKVYGHNPESCYPVLGEDDEDEIAYTALRDEARGKLVLDCGATSSLGSLEAINDYQERQIELGNGNGILHIDHDNVQRFRFGNGEAKNTVGQATLEAHKGDSTVDIAALDTESKYVPMLGSVDYLRSKGAVVDFETGTAIFKKVDPNKIIHLERATSGHLLLDLCEEPCTSFLSGTSTETLKKLAR